MTRKSQPEGTVGERIRGLLSERRMSQRQLAAALAGDGAASNNVENMRRQVSSWVNDAHTPSRENAEALARALNAPVEWLLDAPPRRSMSAALEELGQTIGLLSAFVETETERAEEMSRIVRALDQRLQHSEALIGQLIEGQVTAAAALEEILERLDAGESESQSQRRPG